MIQLEKVEINKKIKSSNHYMKSMTMEDLLKTKVSSLYDVENSLVKALPKMAKAAGDPELAAGLTEHLEETKNHVVRLEKVFALLDTPPKKEKSEAIRGLIEDSEWVIKNIKPNNARDAALIRAAQYVEHYEMAGYNGAIAWADELDKGEVVSILKETLDEEMAADEKLETVGAKIDKEIA